MPEQERGKRPSFSKTLSHSPTMNLLEVLDVCVESLDMTAETRGSSMSSQVKTNTRDTASRQVIRETRVSAGMLTDPVTNDENAVGRTRSLEFGEQLRAAGDRQHCHLTNDGHDLPT
jgi:hypothetical protein